MHAGVSLHGSSEEVSEYVPSEQGTHSIASLLTRLVSRPPNVGGQSESSLTPANVVNGGARRPLPDSASTSETVKGTGRGDDGNDDDDADRRIRRGRRGRGTGAVLRGSEAIPDAST